MTSLSKNISRKEHPYRDLSTALRSGRDDKGEGGASMARSKFSGREALAYSSMCERGGLGEQVRYGNLAKTCDRDAAARRVEAQSAPRSYSVF
jgi:hypothetical protein